MATQEEFKVFYQVHLKAKLIALDKQRQKIVYRFSFVLSIYFVLMILAILVTLDVLDVSFITIYSELKIFTAIMTMIVSTVTMLSIYRRMTSPFKFRFKQEIISHIVTFIDKNLTYEAKKNVPLSEFHASQLFQDQYGHKVDKWTGEDYVEGTLGDSTLKLSEVNALEGMTDTEGNTYYDSIYKGLFFVFNFNLNFEGTTIVLPTKKSFLGEFFRKFLSFSMNLKKSSPIKLSDHELQDEFSIHSNNPVIARYVLSNYFMHRLLAFRRRLKRQVYLSFVDGKLYLAIYINQNLFEPTIFSSVVNINPTQAFFEYLQLGKEIVEDLSVHLKNPSQYFPLIIKPYNKNVTGKVTHSFRQDSCFSLRCRLSRFIVILVGISAMLFSLVVAFDLLNTNEKKALFYDQTLDEGENIIIPIDSYDINHFNIDNRNENKLIHLSGEVTTNGILTDNLFDVTAANMIKLKRVVEMYQWEESVYGYIYYSYSKVWSEQVIDSGQFQKSAEYHNPAMQVKGKVFTANTVKLGAFTLSSYLIEKMNHYQWLPMQKGNFSQLQTNIQTEFNKPIHLNDGNYYLGEYESDPQIGDLRIRFEIVKPKTISVIAEQSGSLLTPYKTQVGGEIGLFEYGNISLSTLFRDARIANFFDDVHFDGIHLRLISFITLFFGFFIALLVLRKVLSLTPSFEARLNWKNWISLIIIAITIAASLFIIMIACFWINYSPILGIVLNVIAVGNLYFLKFVHQLFKNTPVANIQSTLVLETVIPSKY